MPQIIGDSYGMSIGHTYVPLEQNRWVQRKPERTFWSRVQEALLDAGKPGTQTHLATVLKIEQPSISDWNKPGGFPIIERVREIAKYTNVCVEWLYTERGPKHPPPVDETAQRVWEMWSRIDDITKGEIVRLAIERAGPPGKDGVPASKSA